MDTEPQRKGERSLLTLGRVRARRQPGNAQVELVTMWTDCGDGAPQVVGAGGGERRRQASRPPGRVVSHRDLDGLSGELAVGRRDMWMRLLDQCSAGAAELLA